MGGGIYLQRGNVFLQRVRRRFLLKLCPIIYPFIVMIVIIIIIIISISIIIITNQVVS